MNEERVVRLLVETGHAVRDAVGDYLREVPRESRIRVDREQASDVIYSIDAAVEPVITRHLGDSAASVGGVVLIAEGIGETEVTVYPDTVKPEEAAVRVLMDPIDGTRPIMFDKRSAFFLAGAMPNRGEAPGLHDLSAAVMVEIPTTRARVADTLTAILEQGVEGSTCDLQDGSSTSWKPNPSPATSIRGGYAQICRLFPPGRDLLAELEEELLDRLFPDAREGEILTFEDQYTSSGGQLYELITGKDLFVADLRASLYASPAFENRRRGHVCHPYDLAAHLVGAEAGVVITDAGGDHLSAPLNTTGAVDWIGYANRAVYEEVSPVLKELLRARNMI